MCCRNLQPYPLMTSLLWPIPSPKLSTHCAKHSHLHPTLLPLHCTLHPNCKHAQRVAPHQLNAHHTTALAPSFFEHLICLPKIIQSVGYHPIMHDYTPPTTHHQHRCTQPNCPLTTHEFTPPINSHPRPSHKQPGAWSPNRS